VCGYEQYVGNNQLQLWSVVANGILYISVINGWYFCFKSMASEYLLSQVMGIDVGTMDGDTF